MILDNIGMPNSGINLAFGDNPVLGNGDGDILVSLKPKHGATAYYNERLQSAAAREALRIASSSSRRRTSPIRF